MTNAQIAEAETTECGDASGCILSIYKPSTRGAHHHFITLLHSCEVFDFIVMLLLELFHHC